MTRPFRAPSGPIRRKEQVLRAIHRRGPSYVPLLFFNRDREQSDLIQLDVVRNFLGEKGNRSEWGFRWSRLDRTMGQPEEAVIRRWEEIEDFPWPDAGDRSRFSAVRDAMAMFGDRYYLASLSLTGFTMMSFLRGFANLLVDFYERPGPVERLAERVFGFEERVIEQAAGYGFDGVAFADDWGTQNSLIVSPSLWRDFFKPRYRHQFDLAHRHSLDVYFHSCGYIQEIIPDLIEIGVDLLNISQPNLYDIAALGRSYGGRVCFVCPVSYQTTSITGTIEEIYRDVRALVEHLGCYGGGLIGYVEEYGSIGMSEANYQACVQAFRTLGRYEGGRNG
jgi:hypothetical protein